MTKEYFELIEDAEICGETRDKIIDSIECILEFPDDTDLVDDMKIDIGIELIRRVKALPINHIEGIIGKMQRLINLKKEQVVNNSFMDEAFIEPFTRRM